MPALDGDKRLNKGLMKGQIAKKYPYMIQWKVY